MQHFFLLGGNIICYYECNWSSLYTTSNLNNSKGKWPSPSSKRVESNVEPVCSCPLGSHITGETGHWTHTDILSRKDPVLPFLCFCTATSKMTRTDTQRKWGRSSLEIWNFSSYANQDPCNWGHIFPKHAVKVFWLVSQSNMGGEVSIILEIGLKSYL